MSVDMDFFVVESRIEEVGLLPCGQVHKMFKVTHRSSRFPLPCLDNFFRNRSTSPERARKSSLMHKKIMTNCSDNLN